MTPLLKCYPTLSEMIFDLTGWNLPLPIYSFGFFVAMAFAVGAWVLSKELKRKEQMGLLQPRTEKVLVGAPPNPVDLLVNGIVGFLIGFKLVAIIANYTEFVDNPQLFLLSSRGSWIGGLIAGALFAWLRYRDKKSQQLEKPEWKTVPVLPHQRLGDIVTLSAIFGILGARLMVMIETPGGFEEFFQDPVGSFFSGLSIYGGLIAGTIAVMIFAKRKGIGILHLGDAASPVLILAYGIGRIGCQVSGDGDWGIVNTAAKPAWLSWAPDWLWASHYANNINQNCNPYQGAEALEHSCNWAQTPYLVDPVFPTPVYEMIMAGIIFLILWNLRKRISIPGMLFALYFFLNGAERLLIEQIRVNHHYKLIGGLNLSQAEIVAILMLIGAPIFALILYRRNKRRQMI